MISVVPTDLAARQAALKYLRKRYPALATSGLTMLKLQAGWLFETVPSVPGAETSSDRVLLIVNRYGFIEEIGQALPRQSAHRCLAGLRELGAPSPLQVDNYRAVQPQPAW